MSSGASSKRISISDSIEVRLWQDKPRVPRCDRLRHESCRGWQAFHVILAWQRQHDLHKRHASLDHRVYASSSIKYPSCPLLPLLHYPSQSSTCLDLFLAAHPYTSTASTYIVRRHGRHHHTIEVGMKTFSPHETRHVHVAN